MKINLNAQNLTDLVFAAVLPVAAGDFQIKTFKDDKGADQTKTTDDGKPLYRTTLKALTLENGVPTREQKDVSLAVVKPVDVAFGALYKLTGDVVITHYITSGGRLGVSITAESLAPVAPVKG